MGNDQGDIDLVVVLGVDSTEWKAAQKVGLEEKRPLKKVHKCYMVLTFVTASYIYFTVSSVHWMFSLLTQLLCTNSWINKNPNHIEIQKFPKITMGLFNEERNVFFSPPLRQKST